MGMSVRHLLAVRLGVRCHACGLRSEFEKDRTKTAAAIVDEL